MPDKQFVSIPDVTENMPPFPILENDIVKALCQYDFLIPESILTEILNLPEESLVRDLIKLLDDSIVRYPFFVSNTDVEEGQSVPAHVFFILAEKKRTDQLSHIFHFFQQREELTEFYFGDMKTELLWIGMYKLAIDDPSPLFNFLKEPNEDDFCKTSSFQALEQLYYHNIHLQPQIIEGCKALANYYISHKEDRVIVEKICAAELACTMYDIAGEELDNEIRQLYEHDLVDTQYAGTYEILTKKRYKIRTPKIKAILNIVDVYRKVITTWWGYNKPDTSVVHNQPGNVHSDRKIGRNDPCPCGSGKKYKKCCLNA